MSSAVIAIDLPPTVPYLSSLKSWIKSNPDISVVISSNWVDDQSNPEWQTLPYYDDIFKNSARHYANNPHSNISSWWRSYTGDTNTWRHYTKNMKTKIKPFQEVEAAPFTCKDMASHQDLVGAWSLQQLIYLFNHVFDIDNIYFVGGRFDICLINRPTGIIPVHQAIRQKLIKKSANIFVLPDFVHDQNGTRLSSTTREHVWFLDAVNKIDWEKLGNFLLLDPKFRKLINLIPLPEYYGEKIFKSESWTKIPGNILTYQLTTDQAWPTKETLFSNWSLVNDLFRQEKISASLSTLISGSVPNVL